MVKILGVHTSHDSGSAIIENGKIISAINEERLVRKKLFWGLPLQSIKKNIEISRTEPGDIDYVSISGITPGGGPSEFMKVGIRKRIMDHASKTRIPSTHAFKGMYRTVFSKTRREKELTLFLKGLGIDAPVEFVCHHDSHAASAFYTSPFGDDSLVVTTDSFGDGLCSIICTTEGYEMKKRHETVFYHSPAAIYAYVTYNLGFTPGRHEGKITGLAAYGNPEKTYPIFKKFMAVDSKKLEYRSGLGTWGRPATRKIHMLMQGQKREDIAAGLQKMVEEVCSELVGAAAGRYGCSEVSLSGGIFANVRVNQKIGEGAGIKKVYIHPNMGDGGLGLGAGLALWAEKMLDQGKKPKPHSIDNTYFGPEFSNDEIQDAVSKSGLKYKFYDDIVGEVAHRLKDKKIIGMFNGRMEYGPRALGNRSILADPTDKSINDWLNKRLQRTAFMPFAPSLMKENAAEFYHKFSVGEIASQFMTITFDVKKEGAERAPAVNHIDNTARPQTVTKKQNTGYYNILRAYEELTGLPIFVNTSFNMHEEPIVCTPKDAIRSFKRGSVDVLAMGNFIVTS